MYFSKCFHILGCLRNFAFENSIQALTRHGLGNGREEYCLYDPLVQDKNLKNKENMTKNNINATTGIQLDHYVDSHDLMIRFRVSASCLQRLRSQGKIAYLIFGGRAFYLKSDINSFFRSRYGKRVSDRFCKE